MDMEKLMALGFVVIVGQIDRDNTNYGVLTLDGPVLTPAGLALAKSLAEEADAPDAPTAPKRGRPRKVVVEDATD